MTDFVHSVPIQASPERVFAAFGTEAGMKGWWTGDTTMTPKVGGNAEFGFDERQMVFRMRVDEISPGKTVRLSCTGDHPEWAGTTLEWRVDAAADGSVLHFTHRGWRGVTDFAASCNSMWGQLIYRLKRFVETGKPDPQWIG
jgi:uncharacterized protein YndB with AHSA1/START domain